MPAVPRPNKQAQKIADKLLGKPANLTAKASPEQKKINALLVNEQLTRTR